MKKNSAKSGKKRGNAGTRNGAQDGPGDGGHARLALRVDPALEGLLRALEGSYELPPGRGRLVRIALEELARVRGVGAGKGTGGAKGSAR